MLTGILHPTSGIVRVNGLSPQRQRQALTRQIGMVFGQRTQLWWDLPTVDSFEILAAMYDVPPGDYRSLLKEFDGLLGLGEFLRYACKTTFSGTAYEDRDSRSAHPPSQGGLPG